MARARRKEILSRTPEKGSPATSKKLSIEKLDMDETQIYAVDCSMVAEGLATLLGETAGAAGFLRVRARFRSTPGEGESFMKYVTSSLTAVAALGLAGVGSQANASTVTVDFNYAFNTNTHVTLDGVTPFEMSTSPVVGTKINENFGTLSGGYIASTGNAGTDSIDPGLSYAPASVVIGNNVNLTKTPTQEGSGYINLAFDAGGQETYGFATLNGHGGLASITYAIPEPSTWALLIAGAGALGFAAHRRRRRQGVALAA